MSQQNRRDILKWVGGVVGATMGCGVLAAATAETPVASPAGKLQQLPWPYHPLDPSIVGQRAFESFKKGDCMYGSFEAIVGSTAEQLGAPYTDFPFMMFRFGAGGINGWGTVCGAASGAAAAFQLLCPTPGPLIDSLFAWYETAALPNFQPKGLRFPEVQSISGVPLCHASVSMWCKKSGKKAYSPERMERCAAVTASAAVKAVELLNARAAGKSVSLSALPGAAPNCMGCHERGGALENSRGKMDCTGCHSERIGKHP